MKKNKNLTSEQRETLLTVLKARFEKNKNRHASLDWHTIQTKLAAHPESLWSLHEMERTGGEPDVVVLGEPADTYTFYDCAPESPKGRRSVCYDHAALESRKEHKPADSAINMATNMGIDLLTEAQYRQLQALIACDTKTSSWVKTPDDIRQLGGALFCDRRYNHIFVYHNGADSYYGGRGFRGCLRV